MVGLATAEVPEGQICNHYRDSWGKKVVKFIAVSNTYLPRTSSTRNFLNTANVLTPPMVMDAQACEDRTERKQHTI